MRNLLNFLFNYGYWLLFLLLEVASLMLLFRFNSYQGSVGFTSASRIASHIYAVSAEVSSFFKLRSVNEGLTLHNVHLQAENKALREALQEKLPDNQEAVVAHALQAAGYSITPTHIINNSLHLPDNYLTLDKGTADGIAPEMGVVTGNGIAGIVYMVSEHYALAISLLNSKSSISCKFKHNDYFGYLKWKGGDPRHALLEDVPRHALFQKGDTVVTSGYSAVFPQGLMVGTVDSIADSNDGLSYLLRVRLATDFACLDNALIIANKGREEQHALEAKAIKE